MFDPFVEQLCEPYSKEGERTSIPPGTYFRMLFIGYFEGIGSQRGIAWRCADSRSLREFLWADLTDATLAHNSVTVIHQRLPAIRARAGGCWTGKDCCAPKPWASTRPRWRPTPPCARSCAKLTARAWKEFLRTLAQAEWKANPTDEDLHRLDRRRKDKKVSNEE